MAHGGKPLHSDLMGIIVMQKAQAQANGFITVGEGLELVCHIPAVGKQGTADGNETAVPMHFVELIIHPLFLQNIQLGTDSVIDRMSRLQQWRKQKSALRKRLHKGGLKIVIRLGYQRICGKNQTAKDRILGKSQVTVDTVSGDDKNIILVIGGGVTVQLQKDIVTHQWVN